MQYGIGPEVYANYRRHELNKAAPLREPFGEPDSWYRGDVDEHSTHPLREWIGRLLISAGEHLGGQTGPRRTTRRTA